MKTLDLNNPPEEITVKGKTVKLSELTEEETIEAVCATALELLETLKDFRAADAPQTRLPARRDRVALCTSLPYKRAVEDQNKPAIMTYPDKNPVINSLIALEKDQERLTQFDLEIEIAVGHLLDRATVSPVFLSAAQIAREYLGLVDNSATVSEGLIKEIESSMAKLHRVKAYMEWESQLQSYKNPPKNPAKARYKGQLLEFREVVLMAGGVNVTGYQFTKDFLPMHFLHGKATNQLIYPPAYCLDTTQSNAANLRGLPPKKSTLRFKLIQRYLYREIVRMLKTKSGSRGLLYETIYANIGEPEPERGQKMKIDRDIAYCLELWKRQGFIGGYTAKARGKAINKITVQPPRKTPELPE